MKARLRNHDVAAESVTFDFNPETISLSRQAAGYQQCRTVYGAAAGTSVGGDGKPGSAAGSTGFRHHGSFQVQITLNDVVLIGADVKSRCDQLMRWLSPVRAQGSAHNQGTQLPALWFLWGAPGVAFGYLVTLRRVQVNYIRFADSGDPNRARVAITMDEKPDYTEAVPTNPTSGGPPARQMHVVKQGETLQMIAAGAYGTPAAWRPLAELNGIDDPLRVRPGRELFLPGVAELRGIGR